MLWGWLAAWLILLSAAIVTLSLSGRAISVDHLKGSAQRTAVNYAYLIGAAVPNLRTLLEHGKPTPDALAQLMRLREAGSVFRFKLFDRRGVLLLVSDELDRADLGAGGATLGAHHGTRSDDVADIVRTGKPFVELKDGRERIARPDHYSEAYVPVVIGDEVIGVVEVYVDQTELAESNRRTFLMTISIIGVITTLLGLLGVLGIVHLLRQLERQRRAERRSRYLAHHDVLSGALNRASFADVLEEATRRRERLGERFAILCIDLDRFKEVNDSSGHAVGDEVLRQATTRLDTLLRGRDRLARLGGDEFAILLSDVVDEDSVRTLAERAVEKLSMAYVVGDSQVSCGGSVGVAMSSDDGASVSELMHRADLALYKAKADGRGRVGFYDADFDEEIRARRELVADLRLAVEEKRLTLHYQKLFDADGRRVLGCESLLRWSRPEHGSVPPDVFIPLAEENGLIEPLGAWALHEACREAAGWPDERSVAVNLSAMQFHRGNLLDTVRDALGTSGLPPERLELEITESLLMSDTETTVATLEKLAELGVRIAMDDFGTGHSSLAYLWRFPLHKVKLDKSFTWGLVNDGRVDLIVGSIVSLVHSLGIRVNAEGVETSEQLAALRRHGCDEFQGFLLARPVSAESLWDEGAASGDKAKVLEGPSCLAWSMGADDDEAMDIAA